MKAKKEQYSEDKYTSNIKSRSIIKNTNNIPDKKISGFSSYKNSKLTDENKSVYSSSRKGGESIKKKQGQSIKDKSEISSFDINKQGLNQILEFANNKQSKMISMIDESIDFFNGEKFVIGKEKAIEKYEMVEKNVYIKMKENNIEFKQKRAQCTEEHNKLVECMNLTANEIKKLKINFDKKDVQQNDKRNDIFNQENEMKDINVFNEKLHEMILDNRMKRHNIIKSLEHITKKYWNEIPKDKRKIFQGYSSDNLLDFISENNAEKIENLKIKVKNLELELKLKDKDIGNLRQSFYNDANKLKK